MALSKYGASALYHFINNNVEHFIQAGCPYGKKIDNTGKFVLASSPKKHPRQVRIYAGTGNSDWLLPFVECIKEIASDRFAIGTRMSKKNGEISGTYCHAYLGCRFDDKDVDIVLAWKLKGNRGYGHKRADGTFKDSREVPEQPCLGNQLYPQALGLDKAGSESGLSMNELFDIIEGKIFDGIKSPMPTIFDQLGESIFCYMVSASAQQEIRYRPDNFDNEKQLPHWDLDPINIKKMECTAGEWLAALSTMWSNPGSTVRFNSNWNEPVFDFTTYKDGHCIQKVSVKGRKGGATPALSGLIDFATNFLESTAPSKRSKASIEALNFIFPGLIKNVDGNANKRYVYKEPAWLRTNRHLRTFSLTYPRSKTAKAFNCFLKAFDGHIEDIERWKNATSEMAVAMMQGLNTLDSTRYANMLISDVIDAMKKCNVGMFYYDLGNVFQKDIAMHSNLNEGLSEIVQFDRLGWQMNVALYSSSIDKCCRTSVVSKKFSESKFELVWKGTNTMNSSNEHFSLHWKMAD